MFFQTTVPRLDRLGLPVKGKSSATRPASLFSGGGPGIPVFWLDCVSEVLFGSTAEAPNGPATEQRAVNALAEFLQRHLAQSEKFAVHNGKGVKEREGDDFYPQQRQHRHRLVMSAMGQVPVLG